MSGGGQGMYQPNPYGQRGGGFGGYGGYQSFGGGNPWMRQGQWSQPFMPGAYQQPGAVTKDLQTQGVVGDPSQFSNPGMATPLNSPTRSPRDLAAGGPSAWAGPGPGGISAPPAAQPRPYGTPAMSDSFTDSGYSPQNQVNMAQGNQFSDLLAQQRASMNNFAGGFQNKMGGGPQGGGDGPQTPSWYNSGMGPAEHYDLQKFPWLAHINGPNSAPPPQGWNAYAPGSEGYRTVFNPNRGQQMYPNQPWMWPFAGASNSPLR